MKSILNFSEASSIALHGIIIIAKSDSFVNIKKIAEELGSSKHHVAKVMQRLAKAEYIDSFRGPKGGFILKKKPDEISLLEIFELTEGKISVEKCPFGKEHNCNFEKCLLSDISKKIT